MEDKDIKALEALWYERLREEGFQDIEDSSLPSRPLRDWHSFRFITEDSQTRQRLRSEYQKKIDDLLRREDFMEICQTLVKNGNSRLTADQVRLIVLLHSEGLGERKIATQLSRSKTCIHKVLRRVRVWMSLL